MSNGTYAGSYGAPLKLVHAQALFTATATIESAGSYGAYNLGGLAVSLANEGLIEATAGIAIDLAGGGSVVNGASGHTAALVYGLTGVELGEAGSVDNVGTI